jgi:hypothetical protein
LQILLQKKSPYSLEDGWANQNHLKTKALIVFDLVSCSNRMTNLVQISKTKAERKKLTSVEPFPIGLSYSPNLTVFNLNRVHLKRYSWGEVVVSTHDVAALNMSGKQSNRSPPTNNGERVSNGLSKKGRRRIRRAALLYDQLQGELGSKAMLTLGYGDTSKSGHRESKADIDRFIKCLSRYVKKAYKVNGVHYAWVAEIQPKRLKETGEAVVHYHMVLPYFIPKELVNKWWNNAVNKPRIKAGLPTQTLLPNVIACHSAAQYMSKYITEEGHRIEGNGYNMSQTTSKGLKPIFEDCVDVDGVGVEYIYDKVWNTSKNLTKYGYTDEEGTRRMLWVCDTNEYAFSELINEIRYDQANQITQRAKE